MRALLVSENLQDAHNLEPVGSELLARGWEVTLVSLEKFYGVPATDAAADRGFEVAVLEPKHDHDRLGGLSQSGRFRQLREILSQTAPIEDLVGSADATICSTPGPLQRSFAAIAAAAGKPAYCIQEGLVAPRGGTRQARVKRALVRTATRGVALVGGLLGVDALRGRGDAKPFNGFTNVFAMGEDSVPHLIAQGADPDSVVVTGIPRFADLFTMDSTFEGQDSAVLFLGGAFRWHGDLLGDRLQQSEVEVLVETAIERGWHLRIRPHPREADGTYLDYEDTVTVSSPERNLLDDLLEASAVVSLTSTSILEAIILGRIGVFAAPAFFPLGWQEPWIVAPGMAGATELIRQAVDS
ncbi:MAG: alpha-2,8-polysialyltransferase family protein, partial [Acidimicrobiia bacterium]|nr:alpha-2,8-polysialyltransferase family protein [Acidimicrobiia bacterium]